MSTPAFAASAANAPSRVTADGPLGLRAGTVMQGRVVAQAADPITSIVGVLRDCYGFVTVTESAFRGA